MRQRSSNGEAKDSPPLNRLIERIIHLRTNAGHGRITNAQCIQNRSNITDHANSDLSDLEMETNPGDAPSETCCLQVIEGGKRQRL